MLVDRAAAEDAVQEASSKGWTNLRQLRERIVLGSDSLIRCTAVNFPHHLDAASPSALYSNCFPATPASPNPRRWWMCASGFGAHQLARPSTRMRAGTRRSRTTA